ncbi:MAG: hypothetical protein WEA75_11805 [Acidimicrobiia bacterium]
MAEKPKRDLDERVVIPLDPERAMRALLNVDPDAAPELTDEQIARMVENAAAETDEDD